MRTIRLKIIEEGFKHPLERLKELISKALIEEEIVVTEFSDLELKIKFTTENSQDIIHLQLRNEKTKVKLSEKIIPYLEASWLEDAASEAQALLAPAGVI